VARQRFEEGVRHYDARDYDKARLAFLQAYLLKEHPAVLLNLAQSELKAGRYAEAAENFAKYIRENPTAPALDHAKNALDEARAQSTEVNVAVSSAEAAITVDGREVGLSPLPHVIYLMPGVHQIEARLGNVSANRSMEAVAGQRVYVTLQLDDSRLAPAAAAQPAVTAAALPPPPVSASCDPPMDDAPSPGFFSWLGDSPGAIATVTVAGLSLGTSAVLAGFASNRYAAANNAKDQITEALDRHAGQGVLTGTAQPCGEDGLAGGAGPISTLLPAGDRNDLVDDYAAACTRFSERSDSGDRLKTLSLISLVVGVAGTVTTVIWYFTDTGGTPRTGRNTLTGLESATVTPLIGKDVGAISIEMKF
jgi:hypothetical protein